MNLTLKRDPPTHVCTPGQLYSDTGPLYYTLERHPDDPEHACIPIGAYPLILGYSRRFDTILPHVLNVPGRSAIEIHWGNFPTDTQGCILVGEERGQDSVLKSRVAVHHLVHLLEQGDTTHRLIVMEAT